MRLLVFMAKEKQRCLLESPSYIHWSRDFKLHLRTGLFLRDCGVQRKNWKESQGLISLQLSNRQLLRCSPPPAFSPTHNPFSSGVGGAADIFLMNKGMV